MKDLLNKKYRCKYYKLRINSIGIISGECKDMQMFV